MRRLFSSLLVASLLVLPALASPPRLRAPRQDDTGDAADDDDADGDTDDDALADGNVPGLGNGTGIPDVANATNPACVPYYAVRDAILGGIFHGARAPSLPPFARRLMSDRALRRHAARGRPSRVPRRRCVPRQRRLARH